jgi:hypothetical protein
MRPVAVGHASVDGGGGVGVGEGEGAGVGAGGGVGEGEGDDAGGAGVGDGEGVAPTGATGSSDPPHAATVTVKKSAAAPAFENRKD